MSRLAAAIHGLPHDLLLDQTVPYLQNTNARQFKMSTISLTDLVRCLW
jgi:hypothetical protein